MQSSGSFIENHDHVCNLPLVRREAAAGLVDPACKLDDPAGFHAAFGRCSGFDDAQACLIDKERVFAEQVVEFLYHRMAIRDGPGVTMIEGKL